MIDTFGTERTDPAAITRAVHELVDLRPGAIIQRFELTKPIFSATAAYGHFGRTPTSAGEFSWERTDIAALIAKACQ
jgi:S-adenosylmethionine synthetase